MNGAPSGMFTSHSWRWDCHEWGTPPFWGRKRLTTTTMLCLGSRDDRAADMMEREENREERCGVDLCWPWRGH